MQDKAVQDLQTIYVPQFADFWPAQPACPRTLSPV